MRWPKPACSKAAACTSEKGPVVFFGQRRELEARSVSEGRPTISAGLPRSRVGFPNYDHDDRKRLPTPSTFTTESRESHPRPPTIRFCTSVSSTPNACSCRCTVRFRACNIRLAVK